LLRHEVAFKDLVGVALGPETLPPESKLIACDGYLANLAASLQVVRAELDSQIEMILPGLFLVGGQLLDGHIPDLGELVVARHAGLQVLPDVEIERGFNHTGVEVGDFNVRSC